MAQYAISRKQARVIAYMKNNHGADEVCISKPSFANPGTSGVHQLYLSFYKWIQITGVDALEPIVIPGNAYAVESVPFQVGHFRIEDTDVYYNNQDEILTVNTTNTSGGNDHNFGLTMFKIDDLLAISDTTSSDKAIFLTDITRDYPQLGTVLNDSGNIAYLPGARFGTLEAHPYSTIAEGVDMLDLTNYAMGRPCPPYWKKHGVVYQTRSGFEIRIVYFGQLVDAKDYCRGKVTSKDTPTRKKAYPKSSTKKASLKAVPVKKKVAKKASSRKKK